ncbi:MAG: AMP-binding protein, partial [Gammaproteobacteria bacterium]|nr:AMP-binding protein [Gammaproteobacteria bacterium]
MMAGSPQTLRDLIDTIAPQDERPAIIAVHADGRVDTLSRSALARRVLGFAGELLESGVGLAEPILLFAPNSTGWLVGCLGSVCAGALPVPVDCQSAERDLAGILAHSGARRALATDESAKRLRAARDDLAIIRLETLAEDGEWPARPGATRSLPGLLPALRSEEPAVLFYTSGTTGAPKGVPLSHRNLLSNLQALLAAELAGPEDRLLLPLPLHHTYPFTCGLLGSLATGAALVLPAAVTGPELVAAIRAGGATLLLGVPRLYTALLGGIEARITAGRLGGSVYRRLQQLAAMLPRTWRIRVGRTLFRRLHEQMGPTLRTLASGGARLEPEVATRLEGLGWEVLSGYGLTETSPILAFNVRGHVCHESVGRPLPGIELRVATEDGDGAGEVQARGANVFSGYRGDPDATAGAFTADGWFRTGDLGRFDAGGFLHLVGRSKEIIVLPDGKKVAPENIEELLIASPLIREAAVLERDGRLAALIVPDQSALRERGAVRLASMMREEIEAISMRLPAWQRIADYRLVYEPLPRTPLGKLQRFLIGGRYAATAADMCAGAAAAVSAADRALLEEEPGRRVWAWLQERFAGKPLSLDASPQLDLGIDSLEWLTLTLEIRDRFGVAIGNEALARVLTVRDLLQEIRAAPAAAVPAALGPDAGPERRGMALRLLGLALLALDRLLMRFVFRVRVEGAERLPLDGPLLIAPNHASYLDPMAIAAALPWQLLRRTRWAGWTDFMFRDWRWRLL